MGTEHKPKGRKFRSLQIRVQEQRTSLSKFAQQLLFGWKLKIESVRGNSNAYCRNARTHGSLSRIKDEVQSNKGGI